jgi:predicted adenine nucleotide alpha hydrolase (AANH) superfamily ATPase
MVTFYYNNNDITLTNIGSSRTTTTSNLTSSYNSLYYSNDNYSVHGDYTFRRKHETNKERLIRQRAAFKLFYPKAAAYVIKKSEKDFSAENFETSKRENKFKNINLNLII